MSMRRVLVATDGSAGADRAVDAAAELAKLANSELLILTIGDGRDAPDMTNFVRADSDVGQQLDLKSLKQILEAAKERALRSGGVNTELWVGWGDPTELIIDAARREQADVIVAGRRGVGQLTGLVLGSVSQKLASHAPCLVLIVP